METATTRTVHQEVVDFVMANAPHAKLYHHRPSRSSEESMQARFEASGERVIGAKALLVKIEVRDSPNTFAVIVLPGTSRLDSKGVKRALRSRISGARDFRFATPEEMKRIARGMEPGMLPPFGRPIFPDIAYTLIDTALTTEQKIGFNAADFEQSIIMPTDEYVAITPCDGMLACSTPKED